MRIRSTSSEPPSPIRDRATETGGCEGGDQTAGIVNLTTVLAHSCGEWIAWPKKPCLICGRRPGDAHHLRFAQHRALGRKVASSAPRALIRSDWHSLDPPDLEASSANHDHYVYNARFATALVVFRPLFRGRTRLPFCSLRVLSLSSRNL
jgi:hypothetical protein